jgi:photosystem II stability/assembly factor-like uncharacterized protein
MMLMIALTPFILAQPSNLKEDRPARTLSFREGLTFSRVDPIGNKCVMIYGNLSYGGSDFLLRDCGGVAAVKTNVSIGFIDKMIFTDGTSAWFVVGGKLLRVRITEDGNALGLAVAKEVPDARIKDGFFINTQFGWLCGANGTILKTQDGGTTWTRQQSGTDVELRQMKFFNPLEGWVRGSEYKDGRTVSVVLITRDGGQSWVSLNKAIGMELAPIYLTSLSHGCGIDDDSAIVCTRNMSEWQVTYADKGTRASKSAVFFLSPKLGWVVGDSIWHTADGGNSWVAQFSLATGTSFPFEHVVFVNQQLGWAQTLTDVWRTSNGGKSWEKISDRWISQLQ